MIKAWIGGRNSELSQSGEYVTTSGWSFRATGPAGVALHLSVYGRAEKKWTLMAQLGDECAVLARGSSRKLGMARSDAAAAFRPEMLSALLGRCYSAERAWLVYRRNGPSLQPFCSQFGFDAPGPSEWPAGEFVAVPPHRGGYRIVTIFRHGSGWSITTGGHGPLLPGVLDAPLSGEEG